jgi:hypothetical protein
MEVRRKRNGAKGGWEETARSYPQSSPIWPEVRRNRNETGSSCEQTAIRAGTCANKPQFWWILARFEDKMEVPCGGTFLHGGLHQTMGCTRRWAAPDDGYVRSLA